MASISRREQVKAYANSLISEGLLDLQFQQLLMGEEDAGKLLDQPAVDFHKVDSFVHQLKGSSSSIGAHNVKVRTNGPAYMAPPPCAVAPLLQHGWQWAAKNVSSGSCAKVDGNVPNVPQGGSVDGYGSESDRHNQPNDEGSDDDDELLPDSDEDPSDDYYSDASQQSHETRKNIKWVKEFFESLDKLSVDAITEPTRQWHCPACANGPGAIDWYTGLQPLMVHAKAKGGKRAHLHHELAKLLDAELRRRGTSVIPPGEAFGKWRGLQETITDREIVWPPMVVVMNTLLEKDKNDKLSRGV